jgi:hypothetical protein
MPKAYIPATMIITTTKIETMRGKWNLSNSFITGYITKASNIAMAKGKITGAVIFKTPPATIQQRKIIKKKVARPEWKVLNTFFTL